jgi:hypothetical protein
MQAENVQKASVQTGVLKKPVGSFSLPMLGVKI